MLALVALTLAAAAWPLPGTRSMVLGGVLILSLTVAIAGVIARIDGYPWSNVVVLAGSVTSGILLGRLLPARARPMGVLTLYVSNQSFEDPTVRVTITIDDQVVVDQAFDVEGQHNWITLTPDITPGDHTIEAMSDTGAELIVDFTLPDGEPRWAVIDYWYYPEEGPRNFTFDISDQPIGFG